MTRSASGLAAANNTFEESAALVTAMNSTVQDPQKVGTTLKTVSMYLRAAKVEAQEAGIETEGMANSVSKLREDVMALTNGKVDIMIDDSTFKSTYQIMDEISQVWDEMTDVDQAALLEMIGGKRNSDAVMSLIKNFDVAREAYQDALGSEGSALKENEKYLDSIQGRVQQFKASFEELSAAFIDSDFAKGVVSFGDTILRGLTSIIENLGSIPSLITAIVSSISMIRGLKGNDQGLFSLFTLTGEKGNEKLGAFGNSFEDIISTFKEVRQNGASVFDSFKMASGPLAGANKLIKEYNDLLGSSNEVMEEHYRKTTEYSRSLTQYLRSLGGSDQATLSGYDEFMKKSGNSVQKLGIGAKAASVGMNALKSAMNGMLVGLVTFGITALIEKIVELSQATEKAVEDADAAATELNERTSALDGYRDRIFELREAIDSGNLSQEEARQKREELIGISNSLANSYGIEAQGVNLLTGSYSDLNAQLDVLEERDWRQWHNENQKGIQESIRVMTNPNAGDIEGIGQTGTGTNGYRFYFPEEKEIENAINNLDMDYAVNDFYKVLQEKFDEKELGIEIGFDEKGNFNGQNFIQSDLLDKSLYEMADYYQGAYDALNEAMSEVFGADNIGEIENGQGYLDALQGNMDSIEAAIAKHSNNLNTEVEGLLKTEAEYKDFWASVQQAEENYDSAALEGNVEDQYAAMQQMAMLQAQYQSNVDNGISGWDNEAVQEYLNNYFKIFEQESREVNVRMNLKADMEDEKGFKDSVIDAVNQFKDANGVVDVDEVVNVGLDMEASGRDINSPDLTGDEKGYLALKEAADRYDISVEQLCAHLTNLGYIQDGVTEGPRKIYDSFQQVQSSAQAVKTMMSGLNGVYLENTYLTEDTYNAIDQLVGSEIDLSSCIDANNGYLVTNSAKLAEVAKAAQEYAAANLEISRSHELTNYHKLVSELGQLTSGTENYTEAQQAQVNAILDTIDKTKLQIEQFGVLKEQILGTTSGFDEIASAKEYDAVVDYTDDLSSAFSDLFSSFEKHEFGTETFKSAFETLVPEDIYDQIVDAEDQIQAGWEYLNGRVSRYFTFDDGNVSIDYDNTKKFVQDALNTAYEGSTVFTGTLEDFDLSPQIESVYELAEAMGVTEEVAFGMITAINKYNADGDNMFSEFIDGFDGEVYELQNKLAELYDEEYKLALSGKLEGTEGAQVTLDIQEAEAQLDDLRQEAAQDFHAYVEVDSDIERTEDTIAQLKENLKGMEEDDPEITFTTNRIAEAEAELRRLKTEKAQLTQPTEVALTLASEYIDGELSRLKGELQQLTGQTYEAEITTYVATDPNSQAQVDEIVSKIQSLEGDQAQIGVYINADKTQAETNLQAVQDFEIEGKTFSVNFNYGMVTAQLKNVASEIRRIPSSKTITITVKREGTGSVLDGTDDGTSGFSGLGFYRGTAYARGTLGIKHPERNALVGELGPEMYVDPRTGVYRTVGEYGAELIDLPRGAIIFNHIQTEQILKNRRINTRGKVYGSGSMEGSGAAYANGTMHAEGKSHFTFVDGDFTFGGSGASGGGSSHSSNSNKGSSSTHTVKVEADATDLEEQLKDTLDKIKEEIDDIIGNLEHEIFLLEKNHGDPDEIVSIYREMQDQVHAYAEKYRAQGLDENSDYIQDLQKQWWEYQESIQEVIVDTYEKATQEQENAITLTENWLDNAFADRDFKNVQIYVDDIVGYYEKMQQIIHEQAEYYRSQGYSDTSDEVSELSDLWWDYEENIKEVKQQVVDHLIEMVDTASEAVDNIQDVMDTFKDAADEYAKNGGFISVDAFQEIVKLGPQYMQYLEDENGLLQINEESINRVIAAKTEQLALESAMNYIERLRLALQAESIEDLNNLLYATTETTNATWGLVYANLALLDLTGPQYEAALHNINAIRALAQNAISGIGKVTGEAEENLQDMKDGLDDILQYVMDMLEDRVQRQIDALEEMKDSYAELIELKKESMEATKEETDYQDEVTDKVKEIAELQARINALSLDDSRDAQAQRIELEEQMAELQKELADTQADYAYDRQEESLDKMQDAYEEQKDQEIEKLEQTISSQEKLYQMAIAYIESHWDTLYQELLEWNYEYGTSLNQEISTAWENCLAAAQKYGSYVNALNQIDADIENMGSDHSSNITIGKPVDDNSYTNLDMVRAIVSQMKVLSGQWDAENKSEAENDALHDKASALAARLGQYGVVVKYRGSDGTWWIERDELNPGNAGQLLYSRYHSGGIVGDQPTVKQNEVLALLEKGEAVLDKQKEKGLYRLIDFASDISEKLRASIGIADLSGVVDRMRDNMNSIQTEALAGVTNNVGAIQFGDVYIYGSDGDTVQQHIDVNRRFVNEVLDRLNIRK